LLLSGIPSFPEDVTDGVLEGCLLLYPWLPPGLTLRSPDRFRRSGKIHQFCCDLAHRYAEVILTLRK
jgi:hypothetical protein